MNGTGSLLDNFNGCINVGDFSLELGNDISQCSTFVEDSTELTFEIRDALEKVFDDLDFLVKEVDSDDLTSYCI